MNPTNAVTGCNVNRSNHYSGAINMRPMGVTTIGKVMCGLIAGAALAGCNPQKVGYGPDEYDPYTGRYSRATHTGQEVKPVVVTVDRDAERQREILGLMQRLYDSLYNKENVIVGEQQAWISRVVGERRNVPPDPPSGVTSALADLKDAKDRISARKVETTDEAQVKLMDKQLTRLDKDIEVFTKYVDELPTLTPEYKRRRDMIKESQSRSVIWSQGFSKAASALEFVGEGGNGNIEINRSFPEAVSLLDHNEDFVKVEVITFIAAVGGVEGRYYGPRIKAMANDPAVPEAVRQAAAKAFEVLAAVP